MIFEVTLGDTTTRVSVETKGGRTVVRIGDGPERVVDVARPEARVLSLVLDGRAFDVGAVRTDDGYDVDVQGVRHSVGVIDPRRKALRMAAGSGKNALKTTMPGRVVRTLVKEGDTVTAGQPVIVIEAMKMENELKAPRAGAIKRIAVDAGALVEAGTVLVEME
jgi:glutaconyl-CoA/methylmalonyl-CoA decarboxylase subunit gamma